MNWLRLPKKVYFKRGSTPVALRELTDIYKYKRAFLISGVEEYSAGITRPIEELLKKQGIQLAEFTCNDEAIAFEDAYKGLAKMQSFRPDVIIGIGCPAAMSMAKLMAILDENPDTDLEATAKKFTGTPEAINDFPYTGSNTMLVLIPGNNFEGAYPSVTASDKDGNAITMMDYSLLPTMVVIDPNTIACYSDEVIKKAAEDARALAEKVLASEDEDKEYVDGFAQTAIEIIDANLPLIAEKNGAGVKAIENLANAATLAGMAAASTVL